MIPTIISGSMGDTVDGLVGGHQIADKEGGCKGSFLDDGNKFVAQSRQDVFDRLREDDFEHRLTGVESQRAGSFGLTFVHRADTGTDDLSDISAGV